MLQSFIYHCTPFPLQCFVVCDCWRKSAFLFTNTFITLYFTIINCVRFLLIHTSAVQLTLHLIAIYLYIYCLFSQFCVTSKRDYFYCSLFLPVISSIAWKMILFTDPYSNWLLLKASPNITSWVVSLLFRVEWTWLCVVEFLPSCLRWATGSLHMRCFVSYLPKRANMG